MGIIRRFYIPLLFLIVIIKATGGDSNETSSENRQGRGTSRIVKLYSGTRPEPIVCTGEGFLKDPHNCAVFYRCTKSGNGRYTVFRFQCGPGTVYDPDTEVCNHPRSTKRSECGGYISPIADTTHINEIDSLAEIPSPLTSKPIYGASSSTTKVSTITTARTPAPFHSTHTTKRQVTSTASSPYPWGSYITNIYIDNSVSAVSSEPAAATTKPITSSFVFTPSTTSNISPSNSEDNICSSDGFMGDTRNCRKFYRCVANQRGGYTRYEFACSETTVWDDENQICNHAWAVKRSRCSRLSDKIDNINTYEQVHTQDKSTKQTTEENKPNVTIQQQLQISYGSKVSQSQVQISNGSVVQNQTQIHYGDRINHNKNGISKQNQTQISHGSAVSQSQTQINSGDKAIQTQLQIDHSKEASQSQTQVSNTSTKKTTTTTQHSDSEEVNIVNSRECKQEGYMGDSNDCQKFYRCVSNDRGGYHKFEFKCADGTAWDQNAQGCNHVWAVKGCGSQGPSYSTTHSAVPSTVTTSTQKTTQDYHTIHTTTISYQPAPESDNKEDYEDVGYIQPKPPQPSSSTSLSTSSTTTLASTTVKPANGKGCTSSGFMADENDCKIFYRCVENSSGGFTRHEFKCGEGTVWDPKHETCNHAWAVKECGVKSTSGTTTPIAATSPITTSTHTPTQGHQSTTEYNHPDDYSDDKEENDSGYNSQKPPQIPTSPSASTTTASSVINDSKEGKCTSSGFMADENDCKIFYRCVENSSGGYTKHEFKCGEGTVWDPKHETCNHAWAVEKCGKDVSPTTDKVTTFSSVQTQSTKDSHSTTQVIPTQVDDINDDSGYGPSNDYNPITTTTKQPLASSDFICSSSGFIGDKHDCKKFYRCVDNGDGSYTKYEFACAEGTVWDQKIEACNHPWAVEACGGAGGTPNSTYETTPQYNPPLNDDIDNGYPSSASVDSDITTSKPTTHSTTNRPKQPMDSSDCKSSGFFGDRDNCKKFYRCVDDGKGGFTRYEFECGEGTVWDKTIEACNHAWAVEDCGNSGNITTQIASESTTSIVVSQDPGYPSVTEDTSHVICADNETSVICYNEGFIGDPSNCKIFYRCVDNGKGGFTKYEFKCTEGTYWNQEISSCDHVTSDNECAVKGSSSTLQPIHDEIDSVTTTSPKDEGSVTWKPPVSSEVCIADGFYGDNNDCKKFYRCVDNGKGGYTKYDFTCGDGTAWDQEIQTCNHKSEITCQSKDDQPQQGDGNTSISTTSTEKSSTSVSPTSNQCESEGFFAHPNDCKKFIRCVSNDKGGFTKYEFDCGEGTVWVQEMLTCDHDTDDTSCSTSQTKPENSEQHQQTTEKHEASTEKQESSTDKQESSTEKRPIGDQQNDEENNSSEICSSEGFYGNKQDCRKFYRCVDNGKGSYTKYDFTCSEGTAWDSNIQSCNHIDQVPSCQGSVMHDEDQPQQTTSATESSSSSQSPQNSDTCDSEGYFGNTEDCKKFYRCVDNGKGGYTKYDFTCAEGTIWDQDLTTCNHPGDVVKPSCNQNQSDSSNSESNSGSSQTPTESNSQNSTNSQQEGSKEPQNNDINCTEAGFYPNPNDCKKFYRCVDWDGDGTKFSVFHFECGEGTIWDPAVETCNHEDSVYPPRNCSGSQSQSGSESSTTESSTSTQEVTTVSTTQSTTESTTQSTTESTTQSTTESTTQSTTESTTQSTTESTTQSTTESTTQSTTESTTQSTTESTTQSTTESTTQSTTESTTQSTTESTTQSTTESTTQSTTESTTQSTTESTTQSTTESTTQSTTESTTQTTTESSTESATEQSSTTTEHFGESTTEKQGENTTEEIGENITEQPGESTTGAQSSEQPVTDESSTEGSTTQQSTTASETDSTTEENSEPQKCPETGENEHLFVCPSSFRRHPKYCNLFYQCDEDEDTHDLKIAVFTCPNNTIYDESKTKCVEESKADKKCEGEIAQRRRLKRKIQENYPIEVTTHSYGCPREGYFTFEKNSECSPGFLKCLTNKSDELQGFVYQCPKGYVYWYVSRRCEPIDRVKDCKRSYVNDWNNRWQIPVEKNNVAWL